MNELKVYTYRAIGRIPEGVLIGLVVLLGVGSLLLFWRKGLREGFRYIKLLLLSEWVFLILWICLIIRASIAERRINLIPLSSYFDIAEHKYLMEATAINVLNVILFIPVGLLLGFGIREITWKTVLLSGLSLSLLVELLQFIFKRGLCEIDDVIHNLLGCIVGFALYKLSVRVIKYV